MVLDEKRGMVLELNEIVIKNMVMGATFKDYVRSGLLFQFRIEIFVSRLKWQLEINLGSVSW